MLEVAATFNRYRALKFQLKIFDKIQFKFVIAGMFVYSFGFYVYKLVSIQVVPNSQKNNTEYQYYSTDLDDKMGYMHTIVRDGLCVLAIILLNILTMYELKSILMKKSVLKNASNNNDKTRNVDKRLTLMVICMSAITFIGHSLELIEYFSSRDSFFNRNLCFITAKKLLFWLSYQINFFAYYFFNLKFKQSFNLLCASLLGRMSLKVKRRAVIESARTSNQTRNENIQTKF
jgi:hypothetical protein